MKRIFKGRAVQAENIDGEVLVTHSGLNSLASFYQSIISNAKIAKCTDQDNKELYNEILTDKIICLSKTLGSTSAGAVWLKVAKMGIAPKALLFSKNIDSLAAAGIVIANIWAGKKIVVIDNLGDSFLDCVKNGDKIIIKKDGTVIII